MSEPIFREQSLNKVKSPDNLNEYIRIANPGVWTLLAAVLFLLLGFCLWGIFGQLRTVVQVEAESRAGVITCRLTEEAKNAIVDASYNPEFGARPLRRYVQHTVETMLSKRILRGDIAPGQTVTVDYKDGELVME